MFQRLENSWSLVKQSGAVLRADKELLLFPVLSGIALVTVAVSFFVPIVVVSAAAEAATGSQVVGPAGYVVGFLFYFVEYLVIIFFNTALVGAAMIRLKGGDPTVGDGLRIAWSRIGSIIGYAAIAATVGIILRAIRERSGLLGQIAASLTGMAWTLATFLVVPVLVEKGIGPIDAIKESAAVLKRTWGEQIAGTVGIGFAFGLMTLGYVIVAVPVTIAAFVVGQLWVGIPVAVVAMLGLFLLLTTSSALSGIYSAAVYQFASGGESPWFDRDRLSHAFQPKS